MMPITKELYEYLHKYTKRPNKYFIELMGISKIGGFENMYKIIEMADITNKKKITDRKIIIRLEHIYKTFLNQSND